MQSEASQADSDDFSPDEEIIREVSPESSSVQRKKPSLLKNTDPSLVQRADPASAQHTDSSSMPQHADPASLQRPNRPSAHYLDSVNQRRRRSSVHHLDTNEHKSEFRCNCHLSKKKSNKSYVIVPIKQNGNNIKVLKLPLYKMDREPNKSLFSHAKCKILPNDPNHYEIISIPMWSLNQSEITSCITSKQFEKPTFPVHSDAECQTDEIDFKEKVAPAAPVGPAIIAAPAVFTASAAFEAPTMPQEPAGMSAEVLPTTSKAKTKIPIKSSMRRRSSDSKQKGPKWQSFFLNDNSYTRKGSDG